MSRKKTLLAFLIIGSLIVMGILGVIFIMDDGGENEHTPASASIDVQNGNATVSVSSMNDSEEVEIFVEDEIVETMTEAGETTISVADGQEIRLGDQEGLIETKTVNGSDDSQDTSDEEDTTDEVEFEGEGTQENPYKISTVEELQGIQKHPDANYVIVSDIDASDTSNWNDGKGFEPIEEFTGTIDGQNHIITGLTIIRPESSKIGIFKETNGATIQRIEMDKVDIQGSSQVGGITGYAQDTTIVSVSVSGFISGEEDVGMIAGLSVESSINEQG